jgi:predicted transcriptional regulator
MDAIYLLGGTVSAANIHKEIPDPPSYSAVRATLALLVEKGHLTHKRDNQRYLYSPTVSPKRARKSAAKHLVETFFQGSTAGAVAALIDSSAKNLSDEELDELSALLAEAKDSRD